MPEALTQLDPLWDELFPAEQARIVQLLVERVDVRTHGVEVRLRPNGLAGLVREVAGGRRAAAGKRATVSPNGETITIHIPMTFRKRGGRKLVVTPDGRRVGAAAAGRQRDGQGAGAGVPVAEDAGRERVWDDRGVGEAREGLGRRRWRRPVSGRQPLRR